MISINDSFNLYTQWSNGQRKDVLDYLQALTPIQSAYMTYRLVEYMTDYEQTVFCRMLFNRTEVA